MKVIKKRAFSIGNETVDFYVTVMSAKEIFSFSKVSRVDEDADYGYQRLLNKKRAESIADYLSSGNVIPGAIVLSAQEGAELSFLNDELSIKLVPGSFFVIDGQHRLYGASMVEEDICLPVCILNGLDHAAEVRYFIDINSTQKGVPKTLRIELMKFLSEPDSIDDIRNRLFQDLNKSPQSPLYDRMSAVSSSTGRISHVPFEQALNPLLNGDILSQLNYDDKKKILINYLSAVDIVLNKIEGTSRLLSTSAFFQAIFRVFDRVCNFSIMYYRNYSISSFVKVLEGIEHIDFSKHTGTNQAAINSMADEMSTLIGIHAQKLGAPEDLF